MGLTVMEQLLGPPKQAVIYAVDTRTLVRVPQGEMRYAGTAVVRHTVQQASPAGYLIELATLEQHQAEPNELAELLLDIARANSPLLIETDASGNFQRVINKAALLTQWQEIVPWLTTKYSHLPGGPAMLAQVAGQYQADTSYLEQALACKGSCGVLLPGLYGLRPLRGDAREDTKILHQFFQTGALPLRISWATQVDDAFALTADVTGTGALDTTHFDQAGFQHELARLGPPPSRPATLRVQWEATYTASRTGQGLLAGRQWLRATVPGLYEQETEHILRLATFPTVPFSKA